MAKENKAIETPEVEVTEAEVTEEAPVTKATEYVDLFIPRGYANDDPNEFISINGVNFILPKGKTSKVPLYVKEEYDRAVAAETALNERIDELTAKANKPIG